MVALGRVALGYGYFGLCLHWFVFAFVCSCARLWLRWFVVAFVCGCVVYLCWVVLAFGCCCV